MGIKDLLASLNDIMEKDYQIIQLKGKRVAIDASGCTSVYVYIACDSFPMYYAQHGCIKQYLQLLRSPWILIFKIICYT